jgi:hypothetical protein
MVAVSQPFTMARLALCNLMIFADFATAAPREPSGRIRRARPVNKGGERERRAIR